MQTPPEEKNHRQPAPCRGARRLLIVAISASVLLVLATAADLLLRAPLRMRRRQRMDESNDPVRTGTVDRRQPHAPPGDGASGR